MKNKIFLSVFFLLFSEQLIADNLNIQSKEILIDKKTRITIFKKEVVATDEKKNIFEGDYAEYDKDLKLLKSKGPTTIKTSEGYILKGSDVSFDNQNNLITSSNPATILDLENNKIYLERFEYDTNKNFFKSNGNVKVIDIRNNTYNFSQIFIDEKKREILGTDNKTYLNGSIFKIKEGNKPRIFANTVSIKNENTKFNKSIFTLCDYRKNDKCPPWSVQAKEMTHDKKKKTIYYKNAVIKIFDLPIFYAPKLSHPDPTVDRKSGFLPPIFDNNKNLGTGFALPYFWAINKDKDLTIRSKIFTAEHPLILGEYRQAFMNSDLVLDLGYTGGYKEATATKKSGDKSHIFAQFSKNFKGRNNTDNNLNLSLQHVSHDKYLKLYKIRSNLAKYETDTLENTLDFTHENDNLFFGLQASMFENLKDSYEDKYEYIYPDAALSTNLFNNQFGSLDFQTNYKAHNFDTNKHTKFLINDFDWKFKRFYFPSGLQGRFLGKIRNVNYEAKNTTFKKTGASLFKEDPTNELFGAIGYLTEIDLIKETKNNSTHSLTPKILLRYAPGHMRKESKYTRIKPRNVFTLDRLNSYNNLESGASSSLGFDYKIKNKKGKFDFSLAQIINDKENKKMPSSSSLDEKLSDVIGKSKFTSSGSKVGLTYEYALDQNYKNLNYNGIESTFDLNPIKINFGYVQEKKHIGNLEYLTTKLDYSKNQNNLLSFKTKRSLVTNSAEYYNLSYEYLNDCLRAGLVYRREFYNDSELEPENSIMFKVTLIPFGDIEAPAFGQ